MELTDRSNLKQYFDENGYVVIDTKLDQQVLDSAVSAVSPYFGETGVVPQEPCFADYGRVQDAWVLDNAIWKIANSQVVLGILKELYSVKARAFQTLNFEKGTGQATHADSIHFNSEPFGRMCGVWVALEDIGPDQGPLRLYPKSNSLSEINYPDVGLEANGKEYSGYLKAIENVISEEGFAEQRATIKKGQAVIWAANTLHGGAPQNDLNLTRHSQVTHYYLGKPKAWRPSQSESSRGYFTPKRVRNIHGWEHRLHCYAIKAREIFGIESKQNNSIS